MTPDQVRSRVRAIEAVAGDDERAHIMEDELWEDVLTEIAEGKSADDVGCAREALKTKRLDFARYCA